MDRWIAVSDGANAALHALALAAGKGGCLSARSAAEELGVSPTYLAKILQQLARKGLVTMARGASGGFAVSGDAEAISALDVIVAIDGALPERQCFFRKSICGSGTCALRRLCRDVEEKSLSVLRETSVADLAGSFSGKT